MFEYTSLSNPLHFIKFDAIWINLCAAFSNFNYTYLVIIFWFIFWTIQLTFLQCPIQWCETMFDRNKILLRSLPFSTPTSSFSRCQTRWYILYTVRSKLQWKVFQILFQSYGRGQTKQSNLIQFYFAVDFHSLRSSQLPINLTSTVWVWYCLKYCVRK